MAFITSVQVTVYMKWAFNAVIERDCDGYFVATVLDLQECHTQVKSHGRSDEARRGGN
jgi:hypothetical protein